MPADADRAGTPAGVFRAELRFYRTRAACPSRTWPPGPPSRTT